MLTYSGTVKQFAYRVMGPLTQLTSDYKETFRNVSFVDCIIA